MNTQMHYIQTGWIVRTSDGHDLGTVTDLSQDTVFVRDGGGQLRRVSKTHIDEEDEGAKLAILSIPADDLEEGAFFR